MLSPFLLSAAQRRLVTTPAEAPNLPPSAPPPLPLGLKILSPGCLTSLLCVWWTWQYGCVWDWPDNYCWLSLFQEEFKGKLYSRQYTHLSINLVTRAPWLCHRHAELTAVTVAAPGNCDNSQVAAWSESQSLSTMNSTWDGNQSSHPFCLLALGYLETVRLCVVEVLIIVFLTVLIISGNIVVIFVFHCAPLLNHHSTSYFIQTMAYADLLVGVSCLVPSLSLLYYPLPMEEAMTCQVFGFVVSVLKSISMASLACISIDRYIAITKPLTYNTLVTPWRLRLCIFLIWLYSTLVFLPSFFHWGKPGYHGDVFQWCAESWHTNSHFTLFIVMMLYAPAALIVCFTYFNIFRICQQHTKEISERQARFSSQNGETGEAQTCPDKRYAMVLFRITSVFYVLWLPYIIYFLLESSTGCSSRLASFLTTWLAISNSFCNCVIYSLSNSVFQQGLKGLSGSVCTSCASHTTAKDPYTVRSKGPPNGSHIWGGSYIQSLCFQGERMAWVQFFPSISAPSSLEM